MSETTEFDEAAATTEMVAAFGVRERLAHLIAPHFGHLVDWERNDDGYVMPGCDSCVDWGWPCRAALSAADELMEADALLCDAVEIKVPS